ncbi:MAG: chloride channel protein [Saprospiraceae bacterium]|nr:chloride channel protein [Saprospiraceae bacterium]
MSLSGNRFIEPVLEILTRWVGALGLNRWLDQRRLRYLIRMLPLRAIPFWIAALLTGLVAVGYERLFRVFEDWGQWVINQHSAWVFLLTPIAFVISLWLVERFAPGARGSGIPHLMAAVEIPSPQKGLIKRLLSLRIAFVKILSSLVLLLGGGVIGREGPTLQISGSIFQWVYTKLPHFWPRVSQRVMLITGGAAGLAAAFNTPLGGIVFAVEELTRTHITYFRTSVLAAVIIAGMAAQTLLGPYLYFGFPKIGNPGLDHMFWVILFAGIAGFGGAAVASLLWRISIWKRKHWKAKRQYLWALMLGILFATMLFFFGADAAGTGKPLVNRLLFETDTQLSWTILPVRMLGMILSYSVGAAGGVFATALSTGAVLGETLLQLFTLGDLSHNLLLLSCMIGFLTGVTRSPFTAAILVLEMTDRHSAIFYFLLAGIAASSAARLIDRQSFYDQSKEGILHTLGVEIQPKPDTEE